MFTLMQEEPVATYFVSNVNKSFYRDNQLVILDHKFVSTGESEIAKSNSIGGGQVHYYNRFSHRKNNKIQKIHRK